MDPLQTLVFNAFGAILSGITLISEVHLFPVEAIDKDKATFPASFLFQVEESHSDNSRLENNVDTVHIETIFAVDFEREAINVTGNRLKATIHDAIINDCKTGTLHSLIQKIEKMPVQIQYINSDKLGNLVQQYRVNYKTIYGNSFSNTDY